MQEERLLPNVVGLPKSGFHSAEIAFELLDLPGVTLVPEFHLWGSLVSTCRFSHFPLGSKLPADESLPEPAKERVGL
jgi:hypothetical protein